MGTTKFFSWSVSRSRTLRTCPRQAFFEYYAGDEPESRDAFALKELVTLPMLAGSAVDVVIAGALKLVAAGKPFPKPLGAVGARTFEKFVAESPSIVDAIRAGRRSQADKNRRPTKPLVNDWYGVDYGKEYESQLATQVAKCTDTFEKSEILERIRGIDPGDWGPYTAQMRDRPNFELGDLRVYASFDFYCREAGKLVIFDWKTGKSGQIARAEAERQLAVYALYGKQALGYPPSAIFTQAVWLTESAAWDPQPAEGRVLEDIGATIVRESEAERALLTERPAGRTTIYRADRANFPPRPEVKRCLECKFRGICPDGKAICAHVDAGRPSSEPVN